MKNIFILLIFISLSVFLSHAQEDSNRVGFVAADAPINVRERASANARVAFTLPPNLSVTVLAENEDGAWLEIQLADGRTGWVSASLMRVMESAIPNDLAVISPENAAQLEEITQLAATLATGIAFSPDGRLLASYSWQGVIEIYDVRTKILITTLTGQAGIITDVAFSPDGSELASSGADGTVRLWNSQTWGERLRLEGHSATVSSIAFSPNGEMLASAGADDSLIIWDVRTGERVLVIPLETRYVLDMAFSPDGTKLASAGDSYDSFVRVWDTTTGEELWKKYLIGNLDIAFTPDGATLLVQAGNGAEIHSLATDTGIQSSFFSGGSGGNGGSSMDINPAGNLVAVGTWSSGAFFLADFMREEVVFLGDLQQANRSAALVVTFSPDGRVLATSDSDQAISLWGVRGE